MADGDGVLDAHSRPAGVLGPKNLGQLARELAQTSPIVPGPVRNPIPQDIASLRRQLEQAYARIAEAQSADRSITPAAQWLLDNFHVVGENLSAIPGLLPRELVGSLPLVTVPGPGGVQVEIRIRNVLRHFAAHVDNRFQAGMLASFLHAYQDVRPFTMGELWAVPSFFRLAILETLAEIAEGTIRALDGRLAADELADMVLGQHAAAGEPGDEAADEAADLPAGKLYLPFVVQLVERLRYRSDDALEILDAISRRVAADGLNLDECVRREHHRQSANNASVAHIIGSLREIDAVDWRNIFGELSVVEKLLEDVRSYARVDQATREQYRRAIADLALRSGNAEAAVAARARDAALAWPHPDGREADLGWHLVGEGRPALEQAIGYRASPRVRLRRAIKRHPLLTYLCPIAVLTAAILAWAVTRGMVAPTAGEVILMVALGVFPASDLAVRLVNLTASRLVPARTRPRLDLHEGIPAAGKTLVVMPVMLTTRAAIDEHCGRLEVHYLANADPAFRFALLSDWVDADSESTGDDDELLAHARDAIARLNGRHPAEGPEARFHLFHRRRAWNAGENCWMGWERKRGKLVELNNVLLGKRPGSFILPAAGDTVLPRDVRFILTLDGDTQLPIGAVRRLLETALHPLNLPRRDPSGRKVIAGFGVLQPRVTPLLPDEAGQSLFQWAVTGVSGMDPYAGAVSDVYQDLFGEGIFTGKGLYHLEAFSRAIADRMPENAVLSHDLLEGQLARCCLVSDVEVFEEFPSHSEVAAARSHRWMRGDWQLLPWLAGRHGALPGLARWQIFDNLRRSLSAPAAVGTLLAAWCLPRATDAAWIALVLAPMLLPGIVLTLLELLAPLPGVPLASRLRAALSGLFAETGRAIVALALLGQNAWLTVDAVARAITRLFTRRRLLEWITAADVKSRTSYSLPMFAWPLKSASILVIASTGLILWVNPDALPAAAPWLAALWLAPLFARLASVPRPGLASAASSIADTRALRDAGRNTWRFFASFVTAADHHLPPDNFQEEPAPVVARRTSPTNIGLYLLSVLTARDCGWLGLLHMKERLEATLATLGTLETCHGHLLNWYDTATATPLAPRYVSTVDSGNLAGHLLALKQGCAEIAAAPVLGRHHLGGLRDTLRLFEESLASGAEARRSTVATSRELYSRARDLHGALDAMLGGDDPGPPALLAWLRTWEPLALELADLAAALGAERGEDAAEYATWAHLLATDFASHRNDHDTLLPASLVAAADAPPGAGRDTWSRLAREFRLFDELRHYPARCGQLARALVATDDTPEVATLAAETLECADRAAQLVAGLDSIAATADRISARMDFRFLYDRHRGLFSIGYRPDDAALDSSYYDLLASEARLASLLAIARGQVPPRHWFRLGRPLTGSTGAPLLFSWSGSMFEYLMPTLVMHSPEGSLLKVSCARAIRRQKAYGRHHGVPWGISESAFNVRDQAFTYQYSAFGVPGLGLKRGLSRDLVVAPYATMLAAMFNAREAVKNLTDLRRLGALGRYGYYDAVDFTPARVPEGLTGAVVRTYMAHHQGMILVAIGNALTGGSMQKRFHAEPLVKAAALLLQERVPHRFRLATAPEELPTPVRVVQPGAGTGRRVTLPVTAFPVAHLLSNRRYAVMITAAGSGYSVCDDRAVTRWREDAVQERHGTFIYIRDCGSGALWSAGFEPVCATPDRYEACFDEDRARITRQDDDIVTVLEVIVSPEENAELRRVTLTNTGDTERVFDVTSYCEVVLAAQAADVAHPAFSNLFVETDFVTDVGALLAFRRPRLETDPEVWAAHVLCPPAGPPDAVEWETDRLRFLGRHGDVQAPLSVVDGRPLSRRTGRVLDPVFSLRARVPVPAGGKVSVTFATLVAASRGEALAAADKLNNPGAFERASMQAWTYSRAGMHFLRVNDLEARLFQGLATHLLYASPALRAAPRVLAENRLPVTGLWRLGISGDRPIVVLRLLDDEHQAMAEQLLRAQAYWAGKLLAVDIVLLNERPQSYLQELQNRLAELARQAEALRSELPGARSAVFVLRNDQLSAEELTLLLSTARVVLFPREGTLAEQLARKAPVRSAVGPPVAPAMAEAPADNALPAPVLELDNGIGGFAADGREYVLTIEGDRHTPAPWVNVIANAEFGCLVSESGSICSWAGNSRENQLTPWSNDAVTDPTGEQLYLRDDDTREMWTPVPRGPHRTRARHIVRHGQGYSRFQTVISGIGTDLHVFVAPDDPVRVCRLVLANRTSRPRHLSVASYVEWVLGPHRNTGAQHIVTERHASGAILARNPWNADFGSRVAFVDLAGREASHAGSRAEFFGRHGNAGTPGGLAREAELSNRVGAGLDPCTALLTSLELGPGESATVVAILGQAPDAVTAGALIERYRTIDHDALLAEAARRWDEVLGTVQIRTPDRGLDLLVNRWLVYQVLSCRFWGRAGFYQAGGAYGFRDQLQDSLALLAPAPHLVREHLLRAASRQFEAGDVQHWWHPPSGRGVRTRCVDDRLWLPFVMLRYLAVTGDDAILDEQVPFLADRPLTPGEDDAHFEPEVTAHGASLYEHCARTIDASLGAGPRGLPLMGSGDWNDGMNRVGHRGSGESVWMAWFISSIVPSFAELAAARGDGARAGQWKAAAAAFAAAVEARAWDGAWYRRGYFDDGTPLGSATRPECRIDSLAQSWAVLSAAADPARARQAMDAVGEHLVRADANLILLFTPPFDKSSPDPGYIRGYVPGLRENGGQYTHAAIWYLMAEARLGRAQNVAEALVMLNPVHQAATRRKAFVHRTEPYVVAADIASEPPNAQRGGWTWYTGSAAWFHQAVVEEVLGIRFRADTLEVSPVLPPEWPRAELTYRAGGLDYHVVLERAGAGDGVSSVEADGEPVAGGIVQLRRDGRAHQVLVRIGGDG